MADGQLSSRMRVKKFLRWIKVSYALLLFSATILIVAILALLSFGKINSNGEGYIKRGQYQVVFLNSPGSNVATSDRLGNVYFGKITSLSNNYVRLVNVFYLQQGTSTTTSNFNLIKLGCELHGPDDEMIIDRNNVVFWENLKNNSQVVNKIVDYYKANPSGQQCSPAAQSPTQSSVSK